VRRCKSSGAPTLGSRIRSVEHIPSKSCTWSACRHCKMSIQYLDLGKARFLSTKANLLAEIEASAALYCESGKHLDLRPSERRGRLAVCEDIWICKSHDFCLSFVTSTDRDTKCATGIEETHLEEIENTLQAAQVRRLLTFVYLRLTGLSCGNNLLCSLACCNRPYRQIVLSKVQGDNLY
jgi:hypothetical protein